MIMKIITIEEEAWKELNHQIKFLSNYIRNQQNRSLDELWLNNHEVCQYLRISEKTLYRMRKKGELPYSKIHGQYFYTIDAITDMLNAHAVRSSEEYITELIEKGKEYIRKGRKFNSLKK